MQYWRSRTWWECLWDIQAWKEGTDYKSKQFSTEWRTKQDVSELWRLILYRFMNRGIKWIVHEFPCSSLKWNTTDRISASIKSRKEAHIKYYSHNFYLIRLANQTKGLAIDWAWLLWAHRIPGQFKFSQKGNILFGSFPWIKITNWCNAL